MKNIYLIQIHKIHSKYQKIQNIVHINNVSENPITYTPSGIVETDISISGAKFNEIYQGVKLVKLTNEASQHNDMIFKEGLNMDENKFEHARSCGPGGIYFCRVEDMHLWFDYSSTPMVYMWDVKIPDDARTVMYCTKLKTNKIILSNKQKNLGPHLCCYLE